jgi:adenosine deaminase
MAFLAELGARFPDQRSGITLHAGELTLGLVPPEELGWHINEAIAVAGARRIGHGIDIAYDDDMAGLLKQMADSGVLVEINLTSNDVILQVSGSEHPFTTYLEHGVPLALSTDDEGVSRIDLTHEYQRAVTTFDLSYPLLRSLSRNSLQYSFLPGGQLFLDTLSGELVDVCGETSLGDERPAQGCAEFLASSPKASLQWQLERRFQAFEAEL